MRSRISGIVNVYYRTKWCVCSLGVVDIYDRGGLRVHDVRAVNMDALGVRDLCRLSCFGLGVLNVCGLGGLSFIGLG